MHISEDVQIYVRISAQISSQMFRSMQMLRSMCVGVSVFVCWCGCECVLCVLCVLCAVCCVFVCGCVCVTEWLCGCVCCVRFAACSDQGTECEWVCVCVLCGCGCVS